MKKLVDTHIVYALINSPFMSKWRNSDWSLMIRQARRANLLSRVTVNGVDVPAKAAIHLDNAVIVAKANARSVRVEVEDIHQLLHSNDIPFVLLKGAAYLYAGLDFGKRRVYSDVDIMVRKSDLTKAEGLFIRHGWMTTKLNAYDQKYYREWMHELPPLRHMKRQSSLDVHHTIVPPTSVYDLDVDKLWESRQPINGFDGMFTLSNVDMVLHSAVHLFSDGDFDNGIRDLSDITCMIREFAEHDDFWSSLNARAAEIGLSVPLFYAVRYSKKYLKLDVPDDVMSRCQEMAGIAQYKLALMDAMFEIGLLPKHESCQNRFSSIGMFILFVRSHYLRMPLHQLVPHLLRKAFQKEQD